MPKFENFVVIDLNGLTSQSLFTDSLDAIGDLDSHYTYVRQIGYAALPMWRLIILLDDWLF